METTRSLTDWEKDIVDTEWTDKDADALVQYEIDKQYLNLKDVTDLDSHALK